MIAESKLNAIADNVLFLIQAMQQPITKAQENALDGLKKTVIEAFSSIEGLKIEADNPEEKVDVKKLVADTKLQLEKLIDEKLKSINSSIEEIDEEHNTLIDRTQNAEKYLAEERDTAKTTREALTALAAEVNDLRKQVIFLRDKTAPVTVKIFKGKETLKGVNGDVEVEYNDIKLPTKKHDNDAGYDGYVCFPDGFETEETIQPGETKKIPLGICYEIPDGYEIQLRPRSGNTGDRINVGLGTLDAGYRGIIKANVSNDSDKPYTVKQHERICQLIVQKVEPSVMVLAGDDEVIGTTERGTGGFGSTGK